MTGGGPILCYHPWQRKGVVVGAGGAREWWRRGKPVSRGGARPRAGRNLGGRMHLMGGGAGLPVGRSVGILSAVFLGGATGVRVGQGVGSGRDAGQDSLAQPAQAGRQGNGGDGRGTQTVMTRRPRRTGEGSAMTRCPRKAALRPVTDPGAPAVSGRGYVSTRCPRESALSRPCPAAGCAAGGRS